jgi:tetratricopeptide (TPR) repeat protein
MKTIKYLLLGAAMATFTTNAVAQNEHQAVIDQVTKIIESKAADTESQVKDIFKANKKNADVLTAIGRAYFNINDTANAQKYAELAVKRNQGFGAAYVLLGDIAVKKDDGGAASQWYQNAIYFDKKNPEGYRRYAQINSKVDPAGSVATLEQLRAERPDYPVDLISAEIWDKAGNLNKALSYYEKVDKGQMEDYQLVSFALDYFLKGEFDKSFSVSSFGNSKFPKNAALNRISFYNLTNLKRYDEALNYANALFNSSENVKISESDHLYYGYAYLGKKDYDNAIAEFQKSIELNTDNATDKSDALKNISTAYQNKSDYTNAANYYDQYLKSLKEISASDYAGLASIYLTQASEVKGAEQTAAYKKADQIYSELAEKFPSVKDFATLWRARINSYMDPDMKTYGAKPYYQALAESLSANAANLDASDKSHLLEAYQYLGFYFYKIDNKTEYTKYWNKVLELDPTNTTAKQVLGK